VAAAQPGPVALLERLNQAVREGDVKRLALVLCHCPAHALETGLVQGCSAPPLHLAASEGQVDACVLLLQRNAPAEGRDDKGRTPLMLALEAKQSECANTILAHTSNLDAKCDADMPIIHRAAAAGLGVPLQVLLQRGADAAAVDDRGRTAAHASCAAGEPVALMQIATSGAAGRGCLDALDADGCTPALVAAHAAYQSRKSCAALLQCAAMCIHLGADCSARAMARGAVAIAAAKSELASSLVPLHFYAAALGAADLLLLLIRSLLAPPPVIDGATVPSTLHPAPVPVSLAPSASSSPSSPSSPKGVGPPPLAAAHPLGELSQHGIPVLHYAAAHGQLECVRLLLAHGCAPDQEDSRGTLATEYALRGKPGHCLPGKGHADCHQLLLRHLAR